MVDTTKRSNISKLLSHLSDYLITDNAFGLKPINDEIIKEALLTFDHATLKNLIAYTLNSLEMLSQMPKTKQVCITKDITVMALAFQAQLVEGIGYEKELWSKN